MNKFLLNLKSQEGAALIVAVGIVSVLMILSLGINAVIREDIGFSKNTVISEKALLEAEAGVELAMLDLKENLPGFEKTDEPIGIGSGTYSIENTTPMYFNFKENLSDCASVNEDKAYKLASGERVTIPFFKGTSSSNSVKATEFKIKYLLKDGSLGVKILSENDTGGIDLPINSINDEFEFEFENWKEFDEMEAVAIYEESNNDLVFLGSKTWNDFLNHPNTKNPYMIITNLSSNDAYFCIDSLDSPITLPEATIKADGIVGGNLKSIDMKIPWSSVSPNFTFAIYHK